MIDLSKSVSNLIHQIRINHQARSNVIWWNVFQETWNGVSLLSMAGRREPDTFFASDASGSWGCGAYWAHTWFQLAWSNATALQGKNIATQELLPIVFNSSSCLGQTLDWPPRPMPMPVFSPGILRRIGPIRFPFRRHIGR